MNVAIIDDSLFMRRLIRAALQDAYPEAKLTEYADAAKALTELPALAPDLITLDMLMPGMTGLEFLAKLRETTLQSRIIIVTADVQKTIRQKCVELGANAFIDKPITFEKLQLALGKIMAV